MKSYLSATLIALLLVLPACLGATTIHVPDDYGTIQEAINNANNGDTVVIRKGTYTGANNKNLDFGGLAITVKGEGCPEETIIDCNGSGRGFHFQSGEGVDSVVENLTIREGVATYGPGIYCHNNSSPTIMNCIITNGSAGFGGTGRGGGICSIDSSPTISNCTIKNNYMAYGGGIYCENSNPTISDCIIADNGVIAMMGGSGRGGGIYCNNSSPIISNCTISGNTAGTLGGPAYLSGYGGGFSLRNGSNAWIENCLISNNGSADDGGAIYCGESSPTIINCTIVNNLADHASTGGGLQCFNNSTPTIKNCIMWDDTPDEIFVATGIPAVTYSDIEGGYAGVGNINSDPKFVDPDGPDNDASTWEDNDYHLQSNSPCIDSGHSTSAPQTDKEGWPRCDYPPAPNGGGVFPYYDMGAYEFRVFFYVNDTTGNDASNGLTPGTAKKTIQAGINASTAGSVVMVASGTYKGAGNKDLNFGFGTYVVPLRSEDGPEVTIIDCEGSGRGFDLRFERDDVIVDGFTVTDADSSGIYLWASDMTVTNCRIIENAGTNGGGIEIEQCDPTISNCIIRFNTASGDGGGVYSRDGAGDFINCTITDNDAGGDGGGLCLTSGSSCTIANSTITRNTAGTSGGGVYCLSSSYPDITNCILWGDSPDEIAVSSSSPTVTYSDVEGGYTGTGNIDQDPQLANAVFGDYHLKSGSPCIDAGTSNGTPTRDMDTWPRYDDPLTTNTGGGTYPYYDMGAYEYRNDIYVNDATGSDCWDGLKRVWDGTHGPKKTIQGGIDAAIDGTKVFVADGTYTGTGNRDVDFSGKSITLRSENGPNVTIIDCQNAGQGLYIDGVVATVDGFTIRNGAASAGAAIECWNSALTVTNCILTDNTALWAGGAMYCSHNPMLTMSNCTISNNAAPWGGGMYCDDTIGMISNCSIIDNSATRKGGAIFWEWPAVMLKDCTISRNTAGEDGGAMECISSGTEILNCIISDNTAGDTGGAIRFYYANGVAITNCLIRDNSATYTGGGIYFHGSEAVVTNCTIVENSALAWSSIVFGGGGISCNSTNSGTSVVEVTNSILWSNLSFPNAGHEIAVWSSTWPSTMTVTYTDIGGAMGGVYVDTGCIFTWGTGNINGNPFFASPGTDDYRLTAPSPCIDIGDNNATNLPLRDLDGNQRIWFGSMGWTVDMGAYEFASQPFTFTNIERLVSGNIDLTWWSIGVPGTTYRVWYSNGPFSDGITWAVAQSGIPTGGSTTSWTDTSPPSSGERYYLVENEITGEFTDDTVGLMWKSAGVGRNLVSIPFIPYDSSLDSVIGDQLTGSVINFFSDTIEKWDNPSSNYLRAWYNTATGMWEDWTTSGGSPQFGFDEDVGYWITILVFNPAQDICLVGKVAAEERTIDMSQGRNLCGSAYPMEVSLDDSGLIASGFSGNAITFFSDNIEWWNMATTNYDRVYYDPTGAGEWKNWNGTPTTKTFVPCDGFWLNVLVFNPPFIWTYPKPYNEPPNN